MRFAFLFFSVFSFYLVNGQAIYKKLYSEKLNEERQLKILLPRGYTEQNKKAYPVIYVFDADYLFEAVAGNVDYYSYWNEIPDAIVVGVNQKESREDDCLYAEHNSFPIDKGADFFEFVGLELVSFIDKTFKTETFRMAIGHGKTANFINYYLLREGAPLFDAYVTLSPDFAPGISKYISESVKSLESEVFYYLATSEKDVKEIKEETLALNTNLQSVNSKKFLYSFDKFENASHYTLPAQAIPNALERIFAIFGQITKEEFENSILKLEGSPVEYLKQKYELIYNLFGIEKPIAVNDVAAIAAAIKKKNEIAYYEELGKFLRNKLPNTLLGHYYLGKYYEEIGEPKKAMKMYQSAYILEEVEGYYKDDMLEKADTIKAEFGY